jgi:sulfatase maturation enzyme AslB (radical SAM superfamily)
MKKTMYSVGLDIYKNLGVLGLNAEVMQYSACGCGVWLIIMQDDNSDVWETTYHDFRERLFHNAVFEGDADFLHDFFRTYLLNWYGREDYDEIIKNFGHKLTIYPYSASYDNIHVFVMKQTELDELMTDLVNFGELLDEQQANESCDSALSWIYYKVLSATA